MIKFKEIIINLFELIGDNFFFKQESKNLF